MVTAYSKGKDLTEWAMVSPIGVPIDNARLYILDESLNILPIGVEGDLYIVEDFLANGYINNEYLTKEKFTTVSSLTQFLENGSNGDKIAETTPERKKAVSAGKEFMKGRIKKK